MKFFSNSIALSSLVSLLLTAPSFARDRRNSDCCKDKVVGSYIATIIGGTTPSKGVVVLHDDGTMIFSWSLDESTQRTLTFFVGSWKCIDKCCIEFCVTSVDASNATLAVQVSGRACLNDEGELCGDDFTVTTIQGEGCRPGSLFKFCFTPQQCRACPE